MTFLWLIVWLFSQTPSVEAFGSWNTWGIALGVCMFIDLVGGLTASSWRRRTAYYH
jgi:hypothetical protein